MRGARTLLAAAAVLMAGHAAAQEAGTAAGPVIGADGFPVYECGAVGARGQALLPDAGTMRLVYATRDAAAAAGVVAARLDRSGFEAQVAPSADGLGLRVLLRGDAPAEAAKEALAAEGRVVLHEAFSETPQPEPASEGQVQARDSDGYWYLLGPAALDLSGRIESAAADTSHMTGEPVINLRLDGAAGKAFGDLTTEMLGRRLAIVIDGTVLTAPYIQEPILGGSLMISGSFTVAEAERLAAAFAAGALPGPLDLLEEGLACPVEGR